MGRTIMTLEKHWLTNLLMPPFLFKPKNNDDIYVCDRIEITKLGTSFYEDRTGTCFDGSTEIEYVKDIESRRMSHVGI
jgi:hypothetical protein